MARVLTEQESQAIREDDAPKPDFLVRRESTRFLFLALTDAGDRWVAEQIEWPDEDGILAVERDESLPLFDQLFDAGLRLG